MNLNHQLIFKSKLLFWIITVSFVLRLFLIWYPSAYVFDEVYHGFTAREYATGNRLAWDPWSTPPKDVAYEWTHPPLAKEIMALSLLSFNTTDFWGWRIPGVMLGTANIYLIFLIAQKLFNRPRLSLLAAFFYSIDGLSFVQSRTGMNDTYLVFFILLSLLLLLHKKAFLAAVCFGLALASKWAAVYFGLPIFYICIWQKSFRTLLLFAVIPILIYLGTYLPYFLQHYSWDQFVSLQQQMYIYHTHLKATHDYASPWWSWPLNLYPVWYYVAYSPNHQIGNIFASGNPILFLFGFLAILMTFFDAVGQRSKALGLILIGYLSFILPWALSPRIMFLYHYTPSLPFLSLALAYQVHKLDTPQTKTYFYWIIGLFLFGFVFVYPFLVGIPVPREYLNLFFATNLTKNPF